MNSPLLNYITRKFTNYFQSRLVIYCLLDLSMHIEKLVTVPAQILMYDAFDYWSVS